MKLSVILLLSVLTAPFGFPQDASRAVKELEFRLNGRIFRFRHLVSASKLKYDQLGNLTGKLPFGKLTWHNSLEVTDVTLKQRQIKIRGYRVYLQYKRAERRFFGIRSEERVEIEITTAGNLSDPAVISKEIDKAFLRSDEPYAENLEGYWKPFLQCLSNPKLEDCQYYERRMSQSDVLDLGQKDDSNLPPPVLKNPNLHRVGNGVTAPKIRSRVDPNYTRAALAAKGEGTVIFEAIVSKAGRAEILRIIRPLGFGLEEAAADALRKWTFQPSLRDGNPVDVLISIEVNFNLAR
ncbi:MAG: energy transducer TonB [Acidobacteria bacterium]|nr:energy transducer TonB [Acidobacteriota bacterium]